jgi:hypothetical protein
MTIEPEFYSIRDISSVAWTLRGTLIDCVMRYTLIKRRSTARRDFRWKYLIRAHGPGILFQTRTKGPAD